jgi:hypothetical protein
MTQLKTDQSLIDALERAAKTPISSEELERQRVSFIMGSLKLNSDMTRARVEQILAHQKGS